jgi:hypothetical protein
VSDHRGLTRAFARKATETAFSLPEFPLLVEKNRHGTREKPRHVAFRVLEPRVGKPPVRQGSAPRDARRRRETRAGLAT